MARKRFLVIGLGALGHSVAINLQELGNEVIAIDNDEENIDAVKDLVSVAVLGDATDKKMLEQIGAASVDVAAVCIGEHFEANVLATANLLDLGAKYVAARANDKMAASILKRIGAHEVFFVESTVAELFARRLWHPEVEHQMDFGQGYKLLNIFAIKHFIGKPLKTLSLPQNYKVHVLAIRRGADAGGSVNIEVANAESIVNAGDHLFLFGHENDIKRLLTDSEKA